MLREKALVADVPYPYLSLENRAAYSVVGSDHSWCSISLKIAFHSRNAFLRYNAFPACFNKQGKEHTATEIRFRMACHKKTPICSFDTGRARDLDLIFRATKINP